MHAMQNKKMGETPIPETPSNSGVIKCPANKKPLKRGSLNWLRGPDLNRRPSGYEPDELPDCSTPRQSWGGSIRPIPDRVNVTFHLQESPQQRALLTNWYREGDSNPYTLWAQPPQGCVSTNSTTSAILRLKPFLLLLLSWRHVSRTVGRLLLLKHRYIIRSRLLLWNFQHCRVWQTYLSQLVSFLFSKVT